MATFNDSILTHLPHLSRYAESLHRRDHDRANDLVQDTYLRAKSREHLYKKDTNLCGWLVTIMHNEYVNDVRKSYRQGRYSLIEFNEPTIEASQETAIELAETRRAMDLLPDFMREILVLHWLRGMNYGSIALKLQIPIGTVQSRISRARCALRRLLDKPNIGIGMAHTGKRSHLH